MVRKAKKETCIYTCKERKRKLGEESSRIRTLNSRKYEKDKRTSKTCNVNKGRKINCNT
jgi:hypothetical protein